MTDSEILDRILDHQIHVCHETLITSTYHGSHRRWITKKPDRHPISGRYRFRLGRKRRTIYRNKLVWLYFKRTLVPPGHHIDHIDNDNTNDHPTNLRLLSSSENCRGGYDTQMDDYLASWQEFFDYIQFMGHPPPPDSPLWT